MRGKGSSRERGARLAASWPGLSRPSTSYLRKFRKDVDARDKRGHDEGFAFWWRLATLSRRMLVVARGDRTHFTAIISLVGAVPARQHAVIALERRGTARALRRRATHEIRRRPVRLAAVVEADALRA